MGHNRGQLPQRLSAAAALPRRARRRPEKTERPHPPQAGDTRSIIMSPGATLPPPRPVTPPRQEGTRHRPTPPAPLPLTLLPPPPHDLLPDSRVKGASGAAARALRAP